MNRKPLAPPDDCFKCIDAVDEGNFHCPTWRKPEPGEPAGMLFDMTHDPGAEEDLRADMPDRAQRMLTRLNRCAT